MHMVYDLRMKNSALRNVGLIVVALALAAGAILYAMNTSTTESAQGLENVQGLQTVTATEFASYVADSQPVVIDVRTPEEYAAGHLEGARNIDFRSSDFRSGLEALDRAAPYAVYCRSGNRSGQALEVMREMGFTSVVNLSGGILAWEGGGGKVCTATAC